MPGGLDLLNPDPQQILLRDHYRSSRSSDVLDLLARIVTKTCVLCLLKRAVSFLSASGDVTEV